MRFARELRAAGPTTAGKQGSSEIIRMHKNLNPQKNKCFPIHLLCLVSLVCKREKNKINLCMQQHKKLKVCVNKVSFKEIMVYPQDFWKSGSPG